MSFLQLGSAGTSRRGRFSAVVVLTLAVLAALMTTEVAAQNIFGSDCIPPPGGTYAAQFHARYADGTNVYDLSQPRHSKFTGCDPPPGSGSTTHSFGSFVFAQVSINGGPLTPFNGPANTTVKVDFNHQAGATRYFDTEMLQLDLNGGGGVLVRESPTKQSTGKTAITDVGGGQFRIDSFFDVFTELSVDGGQTWHPSTDAAGQPFAGHMEIPGTVAISPAAWSNVKNLYKEP
jgi:hypothetical protein